MVCGGWCCWKRVCLCLKVLLLLRKKLDSYFSRATKLFVFQLSIVSSQNDTWLEKTCTVFKNQSNENWSGKNNVFVAWRTGIIFGSHEKRRELLWMCDTRFSFWMFFWEITVHVGCKAEQNVPSAYARCTLQVCCVSLCTI